MIEATTFIRVRYGETDQMGYVYYGNYPSYYEVARAEFLRSIGMSYKELEDNGILLPVHKLTVSYHAPAKYDDYLKIITTIPEVPTGARIEFLYKIYNEDGVLINEGYTQLIFVDKVKNRPCRAPKSVQQLFLKYANL